MKAKHITLAVALISMASVCVAANWQLASTADDGSKFYIDGDSITQVGKYRKAWVMETYPTPEDVDNYSGKKYSSAKLLYYYDCAQKSRTAIQSVLYPEQNGMGSPVESKSVKFRPESLTEVVPDSVAEYMLKAACGTAAFRAKTHKMLTELG